MQKLNTFLPNKNLINYQFKSNWKIILIYVVIWFAISSGMIILRLEILNHDHVIAILMTGKNYYLSLANLVNQTTTAGLIFMSLVSMVLVNFTVGQEIRRGQITLWMASPLSRNKIIVSKIVFIWLANLLIMAPALVPILIYGGIASDASDHFGLLVEQLATMVLFLLMISTLFTVIGLYFSSMGRLTGVVQSAILGYMFLLTILTNVLINYGYTWGEYLDYINLRSLLPSVMSSNYDVTGFTNQGWVFGSMAINIALMFGFTYLSCFNFKSKDLML
ncbi:hypothetical protein [Williamsoniiplasma luminosum]|uniref:ABC transporter permease n=1 Tax=Williamsoniiplasma luminosum TaxID=214888 RepID=A0A2S0NKE4_9MOLU|nr:hypothetical protein [Williamsoniiplasma luminosum]AVP49472.1 MAG: hypothetical protein C5T88_02750 [Williamsoniiplasma luminosum]